LPIYDIDSSAAYRHLDERPNSRWSNIAGTAGGAAVWERDGRHVRTDFVERLMDFFCTDIFCA